MNKPAYIQGYTEGLDKTSALSRMIPGAMEAVSGAAGPAVVAQSVKDVGMGPALFGKAQGAAWGVSSGADIFNAANKAGRMLPSLGAGTAGRVASTAGSVLSKAAPAVSVAGKAALPVAFGLNTAQQLFSDPATGKLTANIGKNLQGNAESALERGSKGVLRGAFEGVTNPVGTYNAARKGVSDTGKSLWSAMRSGSTGVAASTKGKASSHPLSSFTKFTPKG